MFVILVARAHIFLTGYELQPKDLGLDKNFVVTNCETVSVACYV
jgi:hypothetical protein